MRGRRQGGRRLITGQRRRGGGTEVRSEEIDERTIVISPIWIQPMLLKSPPLSLDILLFSSPLSPSFLYSNIHIKHVNI